MKTKKLMLERIFKTSPKRLWDAWTDPIKYSKWFNPAPGYDLIIHKFEVKEGGHIMFDMPQPNGDLNPQEGVFHTLEPYNKIVSGAPDRSFLVETTFEEVTEGTLMRVEITGVPPEYYEMAVAGWNAGFDKLEKLLL